MSFENSPSLDEFQDGIPEKLSDPSASKKRIRTLIVVLLVSLLVLFASVFANSDAAAVLSGQGSVTGLALDENGNPFQGYIFIMGTDIEVETQPDGTFLVENVPAGARTLVLANEYSGYEFPVQVIAGGTVPIGQIQFIATETP